MVSELSGRDINLFFGAAMAAVGATIYLLYSARNRHTSFSMIDALILILMLSIISGTAIPLLKGASKMAEISATLQTLHGLRSQIELYKAEHAGRPPTLVQGRLPQLGQATDSRGNIGKVGEKFTRGPYLRKGVPPNPHTGVNRITAVDVFPPQAASGTGGWLYHAKSGQIAADVPGLINR